jgi:hypothetical protein
MRHSRFERPIESLERRRLYSTPDKKIERLFFHTNKKKAAGDGGFGLLEVRL